MRQRLLAEGHHFNAPVPAYFRWSSIAIYLGLRSSEFLFSAKVTSRIAPDGLPSGILAGDMAFNTSDGAEHLFDGIFCDDAVNTIDVRFRFQKNGCNGIKRRLHRVDNPNDPLCPVRLILACKAHFLSLPGASASMPFAVDDNGNHIPSRFMATFVKETIRRVAPNTSTADLALYTNHSFRIAGLHHLLQSSVSIDLAVEYLRWRSDAYMLYLRSSMVNFSSLTAARSDIINDFNNDANYNTDSDNDD